MSQRLARLKALVKTANELDAMGLHKEADVIDQRIMKIAEEPAAPEPAAPAAAAPPAAAGWAETNVVVINGRTTGYGKAPGLGEGLMYEGQLYTRPAKVKELMSTIDWSSGIGWGATGGTAGKKRPEFALQDYLERIDQKIKGLISERKYPADPRWQANMPFKNLESDLGCKEFNPEDRKWIRLPSDFKYVYTNNGNGTFSGYSVKECGKKVAGNITLQRMRQMGISNVPGYMARPSGEPSASDFSSREQQLRREVTPRPPPLASAPLMPPVRDLGLSEPLTLPTTTERDRPT